MSSKLDVEIAGIKLSNPTMLASGILGISAATLKEAAKHGAGAVVTKSVGLKPRDGYPNPTIVQVECGLINAMGLPNPGIHNFLDEVAEAKECGVPVFISIYGSSPEEFAEVARVASGSVADALELNVSCPHVKGLGAEIGCDPRMVSRVVEEVKGVVDKPVFVKLTPNVSSIVEVARAAEEAGADALTAINTVRAMAIDIETMQPILANKVGGLSGPAIKPIALRCVYEIYKAVNIPVIGCGGITTWKDAVEFMLAGASAVQIGTAVAMKGFGVFRSIARGLHLYLKKKGFRSVGEIVGLAHGH